MNEPIQLPKPLDAALTRLRGRVRRYILLEGLAIVIAILGVGFWLSFGLDELYFQVRKLELPRWLRLTFTVAFAAALVSAFITWIAARLWHSFGRRMLAIILERRFPELGDSLITAIEMQDSPRATASPLTAVMFQRTAHEAAERIGRLNLESVFDPKPLRRAAIAAGVVVASFLAIGAANASGVERWFQAFVLGKNDYWEPYRRSAIAVHIVTQPGEKIREFDANGVYKHPRGADLTIEAESAQGKPAPERATLSFRAFSAAGVSRGSTPMSRRGERLFRQTLSRVIDDHQLWITAGDYVNREPFRIQIVEPPRIDSVQLKCDYPSYTGLDPLEDKPVAVQSVQASLPMETVFLLQGHTNKPVVSVLLRSELFEVRLGSDSASSAAPNQATLVVRESPTAEPRPVAVTTDEPWLSSDRRQFQIRLKIAAHGNEQLLAMSATAPTPIPIPPIAPLQIYLEDEDGIFSSDPTLLTLSGIADLDPVVDVRLKGVSNVITRLASIPFTGRVTDDYGVAKAEIGYEIILPVAEGANEPPAAVQLVTAPLQARPAGQRDFEIGNGQEERFNLTPLELQDGQKLQVAIYAEDGDDQNGPHRAHGETFTFRIVPGEELLARLYEKELNLRQRYEQIITETRRARADLQSSRERTDEWNMAKGDPAKTSKVEELFNAIDASARRNLPQIRKNQTESREIENAFRDIREEMVNNRVDTDTLLERIDRGVLEPLHGINETDYPEIDGHLSLFALATERKTDPAAEIEAARDGLDRMLVRMDKVLNEMQRRGNINEMIQQLQTLIDQEKKLREETEQRKLEELFEGIGNP
jgi:hypothetical protein